MVVDEVVARNREAQQKLCEVENQCALSGIRSLGRSRKWVHNHVTRIPVAIGYNVLFSSHRGYSHASRLKRKVEND